MRSATVPSLSDTKLCIWLEAVHVSLETNLHSTDGEALLWCSQQACS